MKRSLSGVAPTSSILQQLTALATTVNSLSLVATSNPNSLNNINEFLLYLLKTSQNLSVLFDSMPAQIDSHTIFLNNIALIHHSMQKYSLSSLYFQRALTENAKSRENNANNQMSKILGNRCYEIQFNLGLSLLFSKQPVCSRSPLKKIRVVKKVVVILNE